MTEGLKQRIKTAVLLGIPFLFVLFHSDVSRVILLLLMMILTSIEFLQLHYKPISKHPIRILLALMFVAAIAYYAYYQRESNLPYLLIGGIIGTTLLTTDLFLNYIRRGPKSSWVLMLFYTALPLACLLGAHYESYFKPLMIGTLLLIWVSDVAAYFVGKSIGHRKLMPSVSPGKTREGFLGAGMITILCSYLMYTFLGHFSFQQWAVIGFLAWLMGSIGDLVESKMKRQLNVKDSGTILPGHGGFLDRFDGFVFCLPFICVFAHLTQSL